jgi:hypothetical protein
VRSVVTALDAATAPALTAFLTDKQYDARLEDTRVQVSAMLMNVACRGSRS